MKWTRTIALACAFAGFMSAAGTARAAADPAVLTSFDALSAAIAGVPDSQLNKGQKNAFSQRAANARSAYERGQVCTAANVLDAHLNQTQALRKGKSIPAAELLYALGRDVRNRVVAAASPGDACYDAQGAQPPAVQIVASDNKRFAARVTFGNLILTPVEAGGESWTRVSLPGIENLMGAPGLPAVPSWQALIGVPRGASVKIAMNRPAVAEEIFLNLHPWQGQAADQSRDETEPFPPRETFMDPPFVKNVRAYETPGLLPPNPCAVRIIDEHRDLRLAQVQCNAAQYDPASDRMIVFDSVAFDVTFEGGHETFLTTQTLSPFEPASANVTSKVLNASTVGRYVEQLDLTAKICMGEELLILTHPNFRAAADDLAAWKIAKGISTSVHEVGTGTSRTTGAQIDSFIESRYEGCVVRPSYVLLIGDSEWVPPAKLDHDTTPSCGSCGDVTNGSDYVYATYSKSFLSVLPWFAVGRIPVDTAAEAQTVVDKTIGYESAPPFINLGTGAPFYTTTTNASYFQCCQTGSPAGRTMRTFIETSETVRNAMIGGGYTVERIYSTDTEYQGAAVADPTPRRYFDGDLLPAAIGGSSSFGWNGNATDITDAFNDGRFLVTHRGHGNSTSWGSPAFDTGNFGALSNGALLPFVFSVNCASGFWDRESDRNSPNESFMELLLSRANGGMVAGLGDNRNSPTWANSALTRGFYDALRPNLAPEYGSNTRIRRLADILDHGKVYLLTQIGVAQPAGEVVLDSAMGELIMWHAFGDPTAEIWLGNPYRLMLPLQFSLLVDDSANRVLVSYATEGAVITAFQQTKGGLIAVARGAVDGGVASMPFFVAPEPNTPLILSASLENSVSVALTHRLPDLVIDSLSLMSSYVRNGTDLGNQLTIKVGNIGAALAPGTVLGDGSVKPAGTGYAIDLVISHDTLMPFGPASVPLPAGVAFVEDGLLQSGRVSRTPDVPAGAHFDLSTLPPVASDIGGIVPLQAPATQMHLCARIDPTDAVAEANERNNVTCIPITIVPPPATDM